MKKYTKQILITVAVVILLIIGYSLPHRDHGVGASSGKTFQIAHLTMDSFKTHICDCVDGKGNRLEWKYKGKQPAVIDFYADWCGPCKMVAPVLEELSKEYEGRLTIYKINTEEQQQLAAMFGVRSIPSILFIPVEGQPQMAMGAMPKEQFRKIFKEVLGVEEKNSSL